MPWRRDWAKTPNAWKVYVAYSILFGLIGVVYLAGGKLIGIVWLALAVAWALITGYVRRKSRLHPQVGEGDRQPD